MKLLFIILFFPLTATSQSISQARVINLVPALAAKLAIIDSGEVYQTKFRSDTARVNIYTALAEGGVGSVTNIGTGLGLLGGPITTTGTLLVDTASASILSRQRAASTYYPLTGNPSGFLISNGITPAALTKTDDTNITLTLGGTPASALLQGTSITAGWAGTLADSRITSASNWNTAFTDRLKWDGGATGLVAATGRASLGGTTIGQNIFTLANPSAITFPRYNADNTVDALSASSFRTAIGAGTSSTAGTVTDFVFTNSTGITGTVGTSTTIPTLSLALTSAAVGLGNVTNESKATMFTNATFTGTFGVAAGAIANAALANSAVANLSGTNTGNQTSIVGITGTFAQFNTAVTDADLARTDAANTFTGVQTFTAPVLGTPTTLVGTNITGTAAGFTAGNVTTNANLTGDVISVGNATTIAANAVVLADIQQIATTSLLGRSTAGTGNVEVIAVGSGLSLAAGVLTSTGGITFQQNLGFSALRF